MKKPITVFVFIHFFCLNSFTQTYMRGSLLDSLPECQIRKANLLSTREATPLKLKPFDKEDVAPLKYYIKLLAYEATLRQNDTAVVFIARVEGKGFIMGKSIPLEKSKSGSLSGKGYSITWKKPEEVANLGIVCLIERTD